jgi:hypothetical protein
MTCKSKKGNQEIRKKLNHQTTTSPIREIKQQRKSERDYCQAPHQSSPEKIPNMYNKVSLRMVISQSKGQIFFVRFVYFLD